MHRVCPSISKLKAIKPWQLQQSLFSTSSVCMKINKQTKVHASTSTNNPQSAQATASAAKAESFLSGSSSNYVEQMYESWLKDPNSVHKSWDVYFQNVNNGAEPGQAHAKPPPMQMVPLQMVPLNTAPSTYQSQVTSTSDSVRDVVNEHLSVQALIRGYQIRGHLMSDLDPLGISRAVVGVKEHVERNIDFLFRDGKKPLGSTNNITGGAEFTFGAGSDGGVN